MNNNKGFTLVELLAVIVILALIMGIAVVSISGVLQDTRISTYKETALSVINGVRRKLVLDGRTEIGDYEFTSDILESGGVDSPMGGALSYRTDMSSCPSTNLIEGVVCKVPYKTCSASTTSFVRISKEGDAYVYSICLTAGADNKYVGLATESELQDPDNKEVVKDSTAEPSYYSPDVPTISGGATKVYNYQATTLTCSTATTYDSGTSIYYEFGWAASTADFAAGTITWLGSPSTTKTKSLTKNEFKGTRYYTCRVYVSNGSGNSTTIQATTTTTMSYVNARLYFDATTNGGTISGSVRLYIPYGYTNIYSGRTNNTGGTVPTATKSGKTFTGWWTAASGGSKVIDATGALQPSVSGWTASNKTWLRTSSANNDTANKLYAQFS